MTCIWQGRASVELGVKSNEKNFGTVLVVLGEDGNSTTIDNYFIRLTQLEPYPISTHQIDQSEYVATLFVGNTNEMSESPLKQIRNGIEPAAVKCKEGLVLVLKNGNDSPACVKPHTADILYERNWGNMPPPCCKH